MISLPGYLKWEVKQQLRVFLSVRVMIFREPTERIALLTCFPSAQSTNQPLCSFFFCVSSHLDSLDDQVKNLSSSSVKLAVFWWVHFIRQPPGSISDGLCRKPRGSVRCQCLPLASQLLIPLLWFLSLAYFLCAINKTFRIKESITCHLLGSRRPSFGYMRLDYLPSPVCGHIQEAEQWGQVPFHNIRPPSSRWKVTVAEKSVFLFCHIDTLETFCKYILQL